MELIFLLVLCERIGDFWIESIIKFLIFESVSKVFIILFFRAGTLAVKNAFNLNLGLYTIWPRNFYLNRFLFQWFDFLLLFGFPLGFLRYTFLLIFRGEWVLQYVTERVTIITNFTFKLFAIGIVLILFVCFSLLLFFKIHRRERIDQVIFKLNKVIFLVLFFDWFIYHIFISFS